MLRVELIIAGVAPAPGPLAADYHPRQRVAHQKFQAGGVGFTITAVGRYPAAVVAERWQSTYFRVAYRCIVLRRFSLTGPRWWQAWVRGTPMITEAPIRKRFADSGASRGLRRCWHGGG